MSLSSFFFFFLAPSERCSTVISSQQLQQHLRAGSLSERPVVPQHFGSEVWCDDREAPPPSLSVLYVQPANCAKDIKTHHAGLCIPIPRGHAALLTCYTSTDSNGDLEKQLQRSRWKNLLNRLELNAKTWPLKVQLMYLLFSCALKGFLLEPIPAVIGLRQGDTLVESPVHRERQTFCIRTLNYRQFGVPNLSYKYVFGPSLGIEPTTLTTVSKYFFNKRAIYLRSSPQIFTLPTKFPIARWEETRWERDATLGFVILELWCSTQTNVTTEPCQRG